MADKKAPAPPTLQEVQKENAALRDQIAALKKKLGLDDEKAAAQNIKASFDLFDRDKDGFITKDEFELLAFECGTDVSALTPENLAKAFAAVNPKGDGKVAFADFQKWISSAPAPAAPDQKGKSGLGPLKYKLQSKAWLAKIEGLRAAAKGAPAGDKKDAKGEEKKNDMKLFNLNLGLGEFKDAKASISLDIAENSALAAATKQAVAAPDGTKFFIAVDFALKDGFDEAKVGELCGMLDTMVNAVPWQALPIPVYSSHNVDVADVSGRKVLRITLFSAFDPEELVAPILAAGAQPIKISEVLSGSVKLELPFSLKDITSQEFRLSPDRLKARLQIALDVNRRLKDVFEAMGGQPQVPKQVRLAALAFFVRGIDLSLTFAGLDELVANIPDAGRNPAAELKGALAQLAEMPVGAMLPQLLGAVPAAVESIGQAALYDIAKSSLLGLSRVHVQLGDLVVALQLQGLDVLSVLP